MSGSPIQDRSATIDDRGMFPARPTRMVASLGALAVTMLACGGSSPTATGVAASTTTTPVVTTAPTPAKTGPSTTVGPAAACPTVPLPGNATYQTTAPGNFDGDGQPDVLRAYQAAGAWHLRAELSAGGQVDVTVANVGAGDAVKAVGGFDIDENIIDEAFATVGSGAYAAIVGIWKAGGPCQLNRLTVNGQPSAFAVGASVGNRSGLRCVARTALQALQTQANNTGTQYTGTITNYDVVGSTLVLANTSPPQVVAASDPGLAPYGSLTCGSLKLP